MDAKHKPATPLPWMWTREGPNRRPFLRTESGQYYAITNDRAGWQKDDVAYVAHAANAYQKLVEALRITRKVIDQVRHMNGYREGADVWVGPPLYQIDDVAAALLRELGEDQ